MARPVSALLFFLCYFQGEVSSPRKDSGAGVGEEVLVETPKAGSRKKRLRGTEVRVVLSLLPCDLSGQALLV